MMAEPLEELVHAELAGPVDPEVSRMAAALAAEYPGAARAILFYGSCLRQQRLETMMLDFYLIVSSYREAYGRRWLAPANRLIPPNVFPFTFGRLAGKYAVLSVADFARECSGKARTASVWARFAQPSRLVWAKDEEAREAAVAAVSNAAPTLLGLSRPMVDDDSDPLAIWRKGFALTYDCELRAERHDRSGSIVDADPERYRRFGSAAFPRAGSALDRTSAERIWRRLRRRGRRASLLRLAKASFTFADGIDYLAWKINRHAGTDIQLAPWQRRWPLFAALILLPRLLARGAVR
jgi:hypothetical protein